MKTILSVAEFASVHQFEDWQKRSAVEVTQVIILPKQMYIEGEPRYTIMVVYKKNVS